MPVGSTKLGSGYMFHCGTRQKFDLNHDLTDSNLLTILFSNPSSPSSDTCEEVRVERRPVQGIRGGRRLRPAALHERHDAVEAGEEREGKGKGISAPVDISTFLQG